MPRCAWDDKRGFRDEVFSLKDEVLDPTTEPYA
jgi:hypothetical protein